MLRLCLLDPVKMLVRGRCGSEAAKVSSQKFFAGGSGGSERCLKWRKTSNAPRAFAGHRPSLVFLARQAVKQRVRVVEVDRGG